MGAQSGQRGGAHFLLRWGWDWDVGTLNSPWCSVFQLLPSSSGKP